MIELPHHVRSLMSTKNGQLIEVGLVLGRGKYDLRTIHAPNSHLDLTGLRLINYGDHIHQAMTHVHYYVGDGFYTMPYRIDGYDPFEKVDIHRRRHVPREEWVAEAEKIAFLADAFRIPKLKCIQIALEVSQSTAHRLLRVKNA